MTTTWLDRHRPSLWRIGVEHRETLMADYRVRHPSRERPPLHLVYDALIEEIHEVRLLEAPLPMDRYAQTEVVKHRPVVTLNTLIDRMPGVKDADGIRHVGAWHEDFHVLTDVERRELPPLTSLTRGLEVETSSLFPCYAIPGTEHRWSLHEQAIEAAALAASIADADLVRCASYLKFLQLAAQGDDMGPAGWKLLRWIESAVGVNRTALRRYFEQHGLCRLDRRGGVTRLIGTAPPFRGFRCLEPESASIRSVA